MAMSGFPLDSAVLGYENGRPIYSNPYESRDLRNTFRQFFTNGVFSKDMLEVTTGSKTGYGVVNAKINPGAAIINGGIFTLDEEPFESVALTVPSATATRQVVSVAINVSIDLFDDTDGIEHLEPGLKMGDESNTANPVAPEPTRFENMYELVIATITCVSRYNNGNPTFDYKIIDRRADSKWCGIARPFGSYYDDGSVEYADLTQEAKDMLRIRRITSDEYVLKSNINQGASGNLLLEFTGLDIDPNEWIVISARPATATGTGMASLVIKNFFVSGGVFYVQVVNASTSTIQSGSSMKVDLFLMKR